MKKIYLLLIGLIIGAFIVGPITLAIVDFTKSSIGDKVTQKDIDETNFDNIDLEARILDIKLDSNKEWIEMTFDFDTLDSNYKVIRQEEIIQVPLDSYNPCRTLGRIEQQCIQDIVDSLINEAKWKQEEYRYAMGQLKVKDF
jgi:hypothetical protein